MAASWRQQELALEEPKAVFGWGGRREASRPTTCRTPREVRNALVYVLFNMRKHARGTSGETWALTALDPKSSAIWFDGWSSRAGPALETLRKESWLDLRERSVVKPKTLLATTLWRRHGLMQPSESPRATVRP